MTKAELLAQLEAKKGFHSLIEDKLAPDHIPDDPIEKRYFYINHTNSDGTMGKTFVFYLHDTSTDNAAFYNTEPTAVDARERSHEQKKLDALAAYLKANFNAYFVLRADLENNWAQADVFKFAAGKLSPSKVLVFKRGSDPISHLEIV